MFTSCVCVCVCVSWTNGSIIDFNRWHREKLTLAFNLVWLGFEPPFGRFGLVQRNLFQELITRIEFDNPRKLILLQMIREKNPLHLMIMVIRFAYRYEVDSQNWNRHLHLQHGLKSNITHTINTFIAVWPPNLLIFWSKLVFPNYLSSCAMSSHNNVKRNKHIHHYYNPNIQISEL